MSDMKEAAKIIHATTVTHGYDDKTGEPNNVLL